VLVPPVNLTPPVISDFEYNEPPTLLSAGTWQFADSVTGEWYKNGIATGDTSTEYLGSIEIGDTFFWRETATNVDGVTVQDSNTETVDANFAVTDTAALVYQVAAVIGEQRAQTLSDTAALAYNVTASIT
jgi:hypothetical protein